MILYNMRYRGPYEYDKFVLNTLQISNAILLSETNELKSNIEKKDALCSIEKSIDDVYIQLIGKDNTKGICETMYEQSYIINGGK